jgi:hypothetical protein
MVRVMADILQVRDSSQRDVGIPLGRRDAPEQSRFQRLSRYCHVRVIFGDGHWTRVIA